MSAWFPDTQWSIVLAAGGNAEPTRPGDPLENLCRLYWRPLFAFAVRSGLTTEAAEDAVQGFIARVLQRGDLASVAPERGRFRSWLLTGIRNYILSERRRDQAQRRGAGAAHVSVSAPDEEPFVQLLDPGLSPEAAFDTRWAQCVLERALAALRHEQAVRGKESLFDALRPVLDGGAVASYAVIAAEHGATENAITVTVHRLRQRLRELVRAEVRETVGSQSSFEDEMQHLMAVLTR